MKKLILILCLVLFSTQAYAGMTDAIKKFSNVSASMSGISQNNNSADNALHDVFNTLFYGQDKFVHDNELFNTGSLNFMAQNTEAKWGQAGMTFRVSTVYTGSPHQQALDIMDALGSYSELMAFGPNTNKNYYNTNITFGFGGDYFTWVDFVDKGAERIYSDASMNAGKRDSFMAFSITDSLLLDYYYDTYGGTRANELWVIALDDPSHNRGAFTDLVAVVSVVPVPASIFLLGSGCSLLFFRQRKIGKK